MAPVKCYHLSVMGDQTGPTINVSDAWLYILPMGPVSQWGLTGVVTIFFYFFSGVGFPLYPEFFLLYYTIILQRIRIIVGDAGFEPGNSAPEVWCATDEPPHLQPMSHCISPMSTTSPRWATTSPRWATTSPMSYRPHTDRHDSCVFSKHVGQWPKFTAWRKVS